MGGARLSVMGRPMGGHSLREVNNWVGCLKGTLHGHLPSASHLRRMYHTTLPFVAFEIDLPNLCPSPQLLRSTSLFLSHHCVSCSCAPRRCMRGWRRCTRVLSATFTLPFIFHLDMRQGLCCSGHRCLGLPWLALGAFACPEEHEPCCSC